MDNQTPSPASLSIEDLNGKLSRYEIHREIGRGAMGVVYEAWQVSLKRRVALKVLSGSPGLTPRAVQRFHREAEAAAGLHHTNIVPVYDIGEQDGAHFYAMELIDGPSLDQVIRRLRQAPAVEAVPSGDGKSDPSPLSVTGPYPGSSGTSAPASAGLSSSGNVWPALLLPESDVSKYCRRS